MIDDDVFAMSSENIANYFLRNLSIMKKITQGTKRKQIKYMNGK